MGNKMEQKNLQSQMTEEAMDKVTGGVVASGGINTWSYDGGSGTDYRHVYHDYSTPAPGQNENSRVG